MSSEDGRSDIPKFRLIACSLTTFKVSNGIWMFLSTGMLIFGVLGVALSPGNALALFSPQVFSGMIAFGAFGVLVPPLGLSGRSLAVELLFLIYLLLLSLGIVAQTLALCFFILYFNDAGSISALREPTINADDVFRSNILDLAQEDADVWVEIQDHFDCCGVEFELRVDDEDLVDVVETGNRCEDADAIIALATLETLLEEDGDLSSAFDDFGNFIAARDDAVVGFDELFFCKVAMSDKMESNVPLAIVVSVVIILTQLTAIISASRLYWVPDFMGGWQFDEKDLEDVAVIKGLEMPKTAPVNDGRILSTLRTQAQRVSFRLQNAVTANPQAPAGSGLIGRLSMNRNQSQFRKGESTGRGGSFVGQGPMDMADMANAAQSLEDLDKVLENARPSNPATQSRGFYSRMSNAFGRNSNKSTASNAPPGLPPAAPPRKSQFTESTPFTDDSPFASPPVPKSTLQSGDGPSTRPTQKSMAPPPGL